MKAVLLINIGSPESFEIKDVQKYLNRFLMDKHVINYPFWLRWLLIKKIIVPRRAPKSAEAYKKIWSKKGSPLLVLTQNLIDRLNEMPGEYDWHMAMRYSQPYIQEQIKTLMEKNYDEILLLPAYPQFADSSTTSCLEEANRSAKVLQKKLSWQGKLTYVQDFYKQPVFIKDIAQKAKDEIKDFKDFDHFLFSYHGLPKNHLPRKYKSCGSCQQVIGTPPCPCYKAQCFETTRALAQALGLQAGTYSVSFQSRLGPTKWIQPYTDEVVKTLAQDKGVKNLAVFSLSFITDCLETLEELDIRLKADFLQAGGEKFHRFSCLNEDFLSLPELIQDCEKMSFNLQS